MKTIELHGTSFSIGLKHGVQGKKEVHRSLETYEQLFKGYASLSWKKAKEKALLHFNAIEAYRPEYLDEMEGIARGAGVEFEDILTLNARSEIALTNSPDGCTSLAITEPRSSKTWLAQNWDWKGEQTDSLLFLKIEQPNKPNIEMVTEGGIIGKIGCNDSGIGVCLNALLTRTCEAKVPIHLGLRAVLDSYTFEEALSSVDHNQMASPAHFLIASKEKKMMSVEVSPIYTAKIGPKDGVLLHTNHICELAMRNEVFDSPHDDSYQRLKVIDKLVNSLDCDPDADDIFSLLADHDNYPDSICRHGNPSKLTHENMETVFSIVMDLTSNKVALILGNPCLSKKAGTTIY
ncbi:C45 family peptidase [Sporosarcina sp. JAI121]|uniref:C45 family autoproteolytic acyltransferase/hydolase n=1 Tax=Sporosarcina sp. JAI121 TaxID=2723064 RepID=UPI0015C9EC4B|nr:C45 family peptidase [Sporosarcina sp. JAI121]NYF23265.1 isopenicillin-N N-acyltransferase-like protein [Sporosarcina sp. JAI121]